MLWLCGTENPISDESDYRLEVLIAVRRLERLDKEEFAEDERQEAQETYEQRRQETLLNNVSDRTRLIFSG